jgi:DNA-directed RNA polymerase sigma subunit (sigma70/sigma32)
MNMRQQFKTKFSPGHIDALYKVIYISPRARKITDECIIKDRTYEDIGAQFSISKERVRQIVTKVFRKFNEYETKITEAGERRHESRA